MSAEITVDAFPGEPFKGTVSQVRYSPFTVSGVVTYAAVIEVNNPELKLRPGMTATVTIRSAEAMNEMRLPNAALRYKPSPPLDKDGKKVPQEPLPSLAPKTGRVYVVTDGTPGAEKAEPRVVEIGITDGVHTVLQTDLGDAMIVTVNGLRTHAIEMDLDYEAILVDVAALRTTLNGLLGKLRVAGIVTP